MAKTRVNNLTEISGPVERQIVVGLGEIQITSNTATVLTCIGLGSCIAIGAYDRLNRVGALAHVVLPHWSGKVNEDPAKYADSCVPLLLKGLITRGAVKANLAIRLAGGAQMSLAPGLADAFKTGERNLAEVKAALERENLSVAAAETGGNKGRTVRLYVSSGRFTVRCVGMEEKEI